MVIFLYCSSHLVWTVYFSFQIFILINRRLKNMVFHFLSEHLEQQLQGEQVHFPPDEQAEQHLQLFCAHGQAALFLSPQQSFPIFPLDYDFLVINWIMITIPVRLNNLIYLIMSIFDIHYYEVKSTLYLYQSLNQKMCWFFLHICVVMMIFLCARSTSWWEKKTVYR